MRCLGNNDCLDWSDEREEACPCADNENRCTTMYPPGTGPPGACKLISVLTGGIHSDVNMDNGYVVYILCFVLGLPKEMWCDSEGIWDCPDGSDEANCTLTVLNKNNT